MDRIETCLEGVRSVAIAGHQNPDGDCVGSCLGTYIYLRENFPQIKTDVYMEQPKEVFRYISGYEDIKTECDSSRYYDLLILLDISSTDRIGVAGGLLERCGHTLCFDHHITNKGHYTWSCIDPDASSASEVVLRFLDESRVSESCAEALYTGIVHDTGVFQYSNTSPETMRAAAGLMEKGIPFSKIIEKSFFEKTYIENQILGRALMESIMFYDNQVIASVISRKTMKFYGITDKDLDGIVEQLRNTEGVEVAIFMHETDPLTYRVSLRSKDRIDVSVIAAAFGGGGHKKAAGCTMEGTRFDVLNNLSGEIARQM